MEGKRGKGERYEDTILLENIAASDDCVPVYHHESILARGLKPLRRKRRGEQRGREDQNLLEAHTVWCRPVGSLAIVPSKSEACSIIPSGKRPFFIRVPFRSTSLT